MGLDSYFRIPRFENPVIKDVRLCGGMFSGDGCDGSFRGKVYSSMVEFVAGETLYQEEIDSATVKKIADAFRHTKWKTVAKAIKDGELENGYDLNEEDFNSLASAFIQAADQDCILMGWW